MSANAIAFHYAEVINIKSYKEASAHKVLFHDETGLFISSKQDAYTYIFKYGVIALYNQNFEEIAILKKELKNHCVKLQSVSSQLTEELKIEIDSKSFEVNFNSITIKDQDSDKIRLILLNLAQSVALDYYSNITEQLLEDTRKHTNFLEIKGRLDIGGKKLKKYIGKVLNIKNKISENLYIFDSPEAAWENEELNVFNTSIKKMFDLKERYQIINQQLSIIKENLDLFKDIMFHKESSKLELIIIILIVIEVIDLFILKFIN